MNWTRHEGRALAGAALSGDALFAELEDYIRMGNPQLTDIRLDRATATDDYDASGQPPKRWYQVTYASIGD